MGAIDWNAVGGQAQPAPAPASAPSGAIDWNAVQAHAPRSAVAAASAAGAATPGPAPSNRSFSDQASDFATAAGHHLLKFVDGTGQLGEHAVTGLMNLLPDNPVSRAMTAQNAKDDAQSSQWEANYQNAVPDGGAANAGALVGEVAPFMVEAPVKALNWLGKGAEAAAQKFLPQSIANVGGKIASGGTQGAAVAATQPVTDPQTTMADLVTGNTPQPVNYWSQKAGQMGAGAATGGLIPAVGAGAGAVYNGVKNTVVPMVAPGKYAAQQIGQQLGDQAPAVINQLRGAPNFVPGSVPSAAQAAANPKMVMMEKALANANPEFRARLATLENSNNAARLDAVSNVAQTPEALQAAINSRNAATAPMRDFTVTNGNPVPVDGVNSAVSSVAYGPAGVSDSIGPAARALQSKIDSFTNTTPADTLMNIPGSSTASPMMLDELRQSTNTYLAKHAPGGFVGTKEQAAMMPVKGAIIDAINDANPGHKLNQGGWGQGLPQQGPEAPSYRDYLTAFAQKSVPVNTMEVGQSLQKTLMDKALNSAGDPAATLTNYRGALSRALKGSDYAIDPQAQAALEAVQSDLQRATISNSIRAPGSDTAYNEGAGKAFLRALGADTGSNVLPAAAGAATAAATGSVNAGVAAGFGAKKVSGFMANRVGNAMGDLFLDPQRLAAELQAAGNPSASRMPAVIGRLPKSALAAALLLQAQQQQAPENIAR